jgi:Reverse transcriptase (RNA-dependent DNA polymerase)
MHPLPSKHINKALEGLLNITCVAYIDDICIYSDSVKEYAEHVREILTRLKKARLYIKLSKCEFDKQKIAFLGYVIGVYDMRMNNAKVKTITNWPIPQNFKNI